MHNKHDLLLHVYRESDRIADLDLSSWDLLIRQARGSNMLARLAWLVEQKGMYSEVPEPAIKHLKSARQLSLGHERSVRWELNRVCHAFKSLSLPVIVLKGTAYLVRDMDVGKGRLFNDIDLLVPREKLKKVESTLLLHGWTTTHHDPYDQKYFREWMHELPPLRHIHRHSVLDVHHTILPLTARSKPDIDTILSAIEPVEGLQNVFTLAPVDMVLHSAAHLFHEGEFETGFRGLCDLDGLLRTLSEQADDFWAQLIIRANDLDLNIPLFYALSYAKAMLNTPVPDGIEIRIGAGVPKGGLEAFMRALYMTALRPYHHSCDGPFSAAARWLLYIRSHYIKMPIRVLLPHLFHKAFLSGDRTQP